MHKTLYKTLCVAILLVTALAFMSGSKSVGSAPPSLTAPVIVASGKLINQKAPFSATIYTPGVSGVFRLSAYATITTADVNSGTYWVYGLSWTDATGSIQTPAPLLGSNNYQLGEFYDGGLFLSQGYGIYLGGATRTFQATKGTPIVHSMTLSGAADNSVYAVYYVLERIE